MTAACADVASSPQKEGTVSIDDFNGTKPISSPRSIEACAAVGITPDDLMPRTIASFASPKEDLSFTMKRAERYEQRRVQLLDQVRVARQRQMDQEVSSALGRSVYRSGVHTRPSSSPSKSARQSSPVLRTSHHKPSGSNFTPSVVEDSTVVENERRRLEKIQLRQMTEMQQMINWEIKQAEMEAMQTEQLAMRKRQEEAIEREKARRLKDADEARRQRELTKRQVQLEEVAAARALALREFAEAKKRKEIEDQAKLAWKNEMVQRERERLRKAEEHRQQTQNILSELEAQAMKRMEDMERRDKVRKEKLDRRRHEKIAEILEKTAKNKERIMSVMNDKDRLLQMQREAYAQRQADSDARRLRLEAEQAARRQQQARIDAERKEAEIATREHQKQLETERRERLLDAEREAEIRLHIRTQEKEELRQRRREEEEIKNMERIQVANRMRETEAERQSQILSKSQSKGQRAEMMQHKRKLEMRAKWEEAKLREEAIQDALQRKARRDDYHKSVLMSKLECDQARTDAIKCQKESILQQRRRVKQQAEIQRQEILSSFYKMKITKKFNLQAVESVLGSTTSRPKTARGGGTSPAKIKSNNHKISTRPKTAPRGGVRRPKTPQTRPAVASAVCRQRYISKHISRYPSNKDTATPEQVAELAPQPQASKPTMDQHLEAFRRRQNQELLRVLEEEQAAEEQREVIMQQARDSSERSRLEKIFGLERSQASERIMRLTEEHEIMFNQHLTELRQQADGM
ncbi:hypothetical protein, variant [Aphanomyces invadans]|uniref:Uncharacterized protein n=1 Tax=Aphanomyces invadans TaxID=157072 RepID=A0A024TNE9_9STRA|nr:hypothetical protein, variant [Aphanomyces invadans]ETV95161.1 hypothetical protein, variant [Aphanomyces invadans]|eukprot:XP_008876333.1 hypothetical protein, variant [Aphanomyces invadans]